MRNPYVRYRPLKKPPLTLQRTTLWDYPSQHYGKTQQGSQGYRGATPSYVIWNVVSRFTRPGDVVVDPFCGSGTTLDVCRDLGRDGVGFDIAPFRDDIQRADARRLPLPNGGAHAAFLDPPYADNLTYSDDPSCLGRLRADDGSWHAAMDAVLVELKRVVRPGGVVAIFVCDVLHPARAFHDLGVDLAVLGRRHFELFDHVAVVRHSKSLEAGRVRHEAEEKGFLLRGFSHLLLFRAPGGGLPR